MNNIDPDPDWPSGFFTTTSTAPGEPAGVLQVSCALLTTTMAAMQKVVQAAEDAGIRDQVKIMVGGAPVTDEFRKDIGADAYAADAASGADMAFELITDLP